jgi:hypothetical protein
MMLSCALLTTLVMLPDEYARGSGMLPGNRHKGREPSAGLPGQLLSLRRLPVLLGQSNRRAGFSLATRCPLSLRLYG